MKRKGKRILGCALGVACVWLLLSSRASSSLDLERSFELTYQIRLPDIPPGGRQLRLWVPLAASDEHQKIQGRVIRTPYPYRVTKDPEYGNDILFLDLERPLPHELDLAIEYQAVVRGKQFRLKADPSLRLAPAPGRLDLYLKSNRFMVVNDEVKELARSITAGSEAPAEQAQAIYRYVIERMTYEKQTPDWGRGDTLRACEVGTGNCTDFHSLFISLARGVGIPSRFHIGLPLPDKREGEIPGYHCWAEFYLEGIGWVPVDASEAWKDPGKLDYFFGTYDPNRLTVASGRDIQLIPSPASAGPINIFFKPYAELDGKSFDGVETKFRFKDFAIKKKEGEDHA
ncbi:MAG: transglutaminase domain-containing protein [Candidatus Omnitrophica bacterium]|nr:transglutaminase domain-containing protein [Candidatus Omnitrophota bacterium]